MHASKSQIALEFIMLLGVAIVIAIVLLVSIFSVSDSKTKEKTYYEAEDYGKSLQQEFLIAATLEDGYIRRIAVPSTMNGRYYNITVGKASTYNSYIIITYLGEELYYIIPPINGTIDKGFNYIIKKNNTLYVNMTG